MVHCPLWTLTILHHGVSTDWHWISRGLGQPRPLDFSTQLISVPPIAGAVGFAIWHCFAWPSLEDGGIVPGRETWGHGNMYCLTNATRSPNQYWLFGDGMDLTAFHAVTAIPGSWLYDMELLPARWPRNAEYGTRPSLVNNLQPQFWLKAYLKWFTVIDLDAAYNYIKCTNTHTTTTMTPIHTSTSTGTRSSSSSSRGPRLAKAQRRKMAVQRVPEGKQNPNFENGLLT